MTDAEFEELTSTLRKCSLVGGDLDYMYWSKVIDDLKEMRTVALALPPAPPPPLSKEMNELLHLLKKSACINPVTCMDDETVMTVGGLIEHLREMPEDAPVLVEGYETGWNGIAEISTASVVRDSEPHDWDGEYQFCKPNQTGQTAVLIVGRRGHLRKQGS